MNLSKNDLINIIKIYKESNFIQRKKLFDNIEELNVNDNIKKSLVKLKDNNKHNPYKLIEIYYNRYLKYKNAQKGGYIRPPNLNIANIQKPSKYTKINLLLNKQNNNNSLKQKFIINIDKVFETVKDLRLPNIDEIYLNEFKYIRNDNKIDSSFIDFLFENLDSKTINKINDNI